MLLLLLSSCEKTAFKYIPKANIYKDDVPKVLIGIEYTCDEFDLVKEEDPIYITYQLYMGLTSELKAGYNKELGGYFVGLAVASLNPENADLEFDGVLEGSYYLGIGNEYAYLRDIETCNKDMYQNTKILDNGDVLLGYKTVEQICVKKEQQKVSKNGSFVVQVREVYKKDDKFFSGEIYELVINYNIQSFIVFSIELSLGE